MSNPKSFESSVQEFYEPLHALHALDALDDGSATVKISSNCSLNGFKRQPDKPMTSVSETKSSTYCLLNTSSLTEFIRNDLELQDNNDPMGSLFQDLSGWEIDLKRADKLKEESCLNYLQLSDKKDDTLHKTTNRKKKVRDQVIRALIAKKSMTPTIGYRSKNDWGEEEDCNVRPYALDVAVPDGMTQTNFAEDGDVIPTTDYNQNEIKSGKETLKKDYSIKPKTSLLDLELQKLIEATRANAGIIKTDKTSENSNYTASTRRAFSSCCRPMNRKQTYTSRDVEKNRKGDHIYIAGQKYYNSELDYSAERHLDRPATAIKRIITPTTLPKICNEQPPKSLSQQRNPPKKELIITSILDKKDCGIEIPKWYVDSGTKHTHDRDLLRFMEIMGSKSNLRTPRKLSANGFLSLTMPNKPPEMRGLVIEQKKRASFNNALDEVIQEQSLKLDVMKVPILNSNQRSFAEEVQVNRQKKMTL